MTTFGMGLGLREGLEGARERIGAERGLLAGLRYW